MRKKFRENILSVNIDKLVYVSEKYLTDKPSRAVLTSKKSCIYHVFHSLIFFNDMIGSAGYSHIYIMILHHNYDGRITVLSTPYFLAGQVIQKKRHPQVLAT